MWGRIAAIQYGAGERREEEGNSESETSQ